MEENLNVRNWASTIDPNTLLQAEMTARLPILAGPLALMPDAHYGKGSTIGSVIATKGAIIPAAVGVDIGCGMIGQCTNISADMLPDSLDALLHSIERSVPAGMGKQRSDNQPVKVGRWMRENPIPGWDLVKHPERAYGQLGSLGGGNHFVEVCLDTHDRVWVVLHSGSRGIGNQLAQHHIRVAGKLEFAHKMEDKLLAYFTQGTDEFGAYIRDMLWAQDYAYFNREIMMANVLKDLAYYVYGTNTSIRDGEPVNCHHNYATEEVHSVGKVWVTRKGAIKAGPNDYGVIPGSMGQQSYIVKGLGNVDSYYSASHGAGRVMSRTKAKKNLGDDAFDALDGVTWQSDKAEQLKDEAPAAYKDIDQVMADQEDLVFVMHELRAILNYKGTN